MYYSKTINVATHIQLTEFYAAVLPLKLEQT